MNLSDVAPVAIGPHSYSLAALVEHVTKNDKRYNDSAEDARQGKRTRDSIASGDILPADLKKLAEVLEKPTCGWGSFSLTRDVSRPDGTVTQVQQRVQVPTSEFLPLIDAVQTAAASVP
ncbi:MAG: hypothetical protein H0U64_05375 [Gemmatimonadaceae bacterium]|nr:hypothetical protein [Gemmatimonadaceae bacterium]